MIFQYDVGYSFTDTFLSHLPQDLPVDFSFISTSSKINFATAFLFSVQCSEQLND